MLRQVEGVVAEDEGDLKIGIDAGSTVLMNLKIPDAGPCIHGGHALPAVPLVLTGSACEERLDAN